MYADVPKWPRNRPLTGVALTPDDVTQTQSKHLRFTHHALAVLGASMLAATILSVVLMATLTVVAGERLVGLSWLFGVATAFWLFVFIIALPSAAIALSLLWPVTRRRTLATNWICLIAGATTGIILAPLASRGWHGATATQLLVFALIGAAVAAAYLVILSRLDYDAGPSLFAKWRHRRVIPEQASFDFG